MTTADYTPAPDLRASGPLKYRRCRSYTLLVVGIIVVAALLRFVALDQYPLPIHQDELSDSYDGYSLATTGADRAGDRWPIIIRGMGPGDYHPGLYVYLATVTTGLTGFSVWAGRLPAAIAGIVTVVLVSLTARMLLGRRGALLALLFIAFSPIHVLYSRQAHTGGCLPPLFTILVVYLLHRSLEASPKTRPRRRAQGPLRKSCGGAPLPSPLIEGATNPLPSSVVKGGEGSPLSPLTKGGKRGVMRRTIPKLALAWIAAAGFTVGLSTSAYGASRLSGLLFAFFGVALLIVEIGFRRRTWYQAGAAVVVFALAVGLGAAPQLYAAITQPEQFFARADNVVPSLGNGARWWAKKMLINLGLNLDPRHLFFSFGQYQDLSVARLSVASLPFLYIGFIAALLRALIRRHLGAILLLGTVLICLMPAAVGRVNPHPMRASGVWALYPILAAMGAQTLGTLLRQLYNWASKPVSGFACRVASLLPPLTRGDKGRFSLPLITGDQAVSAPHRSRKRAKRAPDTSPHGGWHGQADPPKAEELGRGLRGGLQPLPRTDPAGSLLESATPLNTSISGDKGGSSLPLITGDQAVSAPHRSRKRAKRARDTAPCGLAPRDRPATIATGVLALAISVTGIANVARYLEHDQWHGIGAQNHLVEIGRNLHGQVDHYDRVYIDAPGLFPYLYVSVFSGMSPGEFQRAPRGGFVTAFGWEKFHRFGRFHFAPTDQAQQAWYDSPQNETWLLVTADGNTTEFHPEQHAQAQLP